MDYSNKCMLEDEILREFEKLKELEPGTDQHKATSDNIAKLMDRSIELEKIENAAADKVKENDFKERQLKNDTKLKWISCGITIAGIIIEVGVRVWGTKKTLTFEQTGTVTTSAGRNWISSLFRKK